MKPWRSRIVGLAVLCMGLVLMVVPIFAQQPAGEAEGGGRLLREQKKPDSPIPTTATEQPPGEAEGGGRLIREQEAPAAPICAGCLAPTFGEGAREASRRMDGSNWMLSTAIGTPIRSIPVSSMAMPLQQVKAVMLQPR